jgi:hypothetical protein
MGMIHPVLRCAGAENTVKKLQAGWGNARWRQRKRVNKSSHLESAVLDEYSIADCVGFVK